MNQGAQILAGEFGDVVWIRVGGKGDFQNSPDLKRYALHMIGNGTSQIVVDLEDCPMMDSTFMGTLTGIAIRLKAASGGKLQIINANPRNRQLLEGLGLDLILELDIDGSAWKDERDLVKANLTQPKPGGPLSKKNHAEFVLEAHEALCKANEENVRRFKDVIDFLRNDAEKQSS